MIRARVRPLTPARGAAETTATIASTTLPFMDFQVGMAHNGEVQIYFESIGDPDRPTLLLVNGLGSQCVNYSTDWCRQFSDEGFRVIRFDNRDVGLSSKMDDGNYSLSDMADDAVAVLDEVNVSLAHVMGCSLGGMIVQRLAIDHPDRLLSVTSVMSRTGEPGYGDSSEAALELLLTPPPASSCGQHRASRRCTTRLWIEAGMARRRRQPSPSGHRLRPVLLSIRGR